MEKISVESLEPQYKDPGHQGWSEEDIESLLDYDYDQEPNANDAYSYTSRDSWEDYFPQRFPKKPSDPALSLPQHPAPHPASPVKKNTKKEKKHVQHQQQSNNELD